MTNRHCLIVEDTEPFVLLLQSYFKKLPFFNQITVCTSCAEAIEVLSSQKIDLIMLDIHLPDMSGMDFLKSVPELTLPPTIIISSYTEYAVESYKIGKAIDYLHKPFDFERFMLAINRALNIKLSNNSFVDNQFVFLKKSRTLQRFEFDTIDYIEAYGIYSKVYMNNGTTYEVVNETISNLEELLDNHVFARIHKSYIININKITTIDSGHFGISTDIKVPIGRFYKANYEAILRLFDKNNDITL